MPLLMLKTRFRSEKARPFADRVATSVKPHDHLAEDVIGFEPHLGRSKLVEREHRVDDRAHQFAFQPRDDLAGEKPGGGDFLLKRARRRVVPTTVSRLRSITFKSRGAAAPPSSPTRTSRPC